MVEFLVFAQPQPPTDGILSWIIIILLCLFGLGLLIIVVVDTWWRAGISGSVKHIETQLTTMLTSYRRHRRGSQEKHAATERKLTDTQNLAEATKDIVEKHEHRLKVAEEFLKKLNE